MNTPDIQVQQTDWIEEFTPDEMQEFLVSDNICKIVGEDLTKIYPNRNWHIKASARNGIVEIKNPDISMSHGMIVYIPATIPELLTKTRKSAGELLERFNLTRSKHTNNLDVMMLPRNAKGFVANSEKGELDTTIKQNIILE